MERDTFFGLSNRVKRAVFRAKGIEQLYEWQINCLNLKSVQERKNLLYSVPTSGGKTLVAEILMLKELLLRKKSALYIVPFVSLAQEKIASLSALAVELGFWVEEYVSFRGAYPPVKLKNGQTVAYICTIEKGLSLVNCLITEKRLDEIGIAVIDEMHLIGEDSRGGTLEHLVIHLIAENIFIVSMTATIGNMPQMAQFLKASTFTCSFRPVSLKEYIVVKDEIFSVCYSPKLRIEPYKQFSDEVNPEIAAKDPSRLFALISDVIPSQSCLIFCANKKNCENVSILLAKLLSLSDQTTHLSHKQKEKQSLLFALKSETSSDDGLELVCPLLLKTIPFGIAYHHSGLSSGERKLIEEGYLSGVLCIICCTSTLAAGVNLPAKRVILRSPYIGAEFITLAKYKQMIGRAGRAGFGLSGESFLICDTSEALKVKAMLSCPMDTVQSKLNEDQIKNFIISAIALEKASTCSSVLDYFDISFFKITGQGQDDSIQTIMSNIVDQLVLDGIILKEKDNLHLTPLGVAIFKANIKTSIALELYSSLKEAQKSLVLTSEIHLIYLLMGFELQMIPSKEDWGYIFLNMEEDDSVFATKMGLTKSVCSQLLKGFPAKGVSPSVLNRFYASLMVKDLLIGKSVNVVSKKYKLSRGTITQCVSNAGTFASAVVRFCEVLPELWYFAKLLSIFPEKLTLCREAELLPLLELPGVKMGRARLFRKSGFDTLVKIASTDPRRLCAAAKLLPLKQAKSIVAAAKLKVMFKYTCLLEEAAELNLSSVPPSEI